MEMMPEFSSMVRNLPFSHCNTLNDYVYWKAGKMASSIPTEVSYWMKLMRPDNDPSELDAPTSLQRYDTCFGNWKHISPVKLLLQLSEWVVFTRSTSCSNSRYEGGFRQILCMLVHSLQQQKQLIQLKIDWVKKVLHPARHKIGHFGDILPSQSLG